MTSEKKTAMRAAVIHERTGITYVSDYPLPVNGPGEARIRIDRAGICQTDLELTKGYMGFTGVPGHEFIGVVDRCDDPLWLGRRVAGEINAACGQCEWCRNGLGRHCPDRTVLGILKRDGCMADCCTLPMENLVPMPESIEPDRAILIEPLSAACEILEQLALTGDERIVVLGDGRLGILCAWVLCTIAQDVTLIGHHTRKLDLAAWRHVKTARGPAGSVAGADLVVEATGRGEGVQEAMALCRPRGTIVLKSTVALQGKVNLAPIVIDELTVVGSRCGRFADGLTVMEAHPDMPLERLITARYPIERVVDAFTHAQHPDALKIIIEFDEFEVPKVS